MTWDEVKELGPLYAVGALDEQTARAVEDYLRGATPEQQREIAGWVEVAALIPLGLSAPSVPENLRDRLLKRIGAEPQTTQPANDEGRIKPRVESTVVTPDSSAKVLPFAPPQRTESPTTRWLLMAATVLLTFASGYLLWQNMKINQENRELAERIKKAEEDRDKIISPLTRVIGLFGKEGAPQASAKLVWDTNLQTWVIYILNLPEAPNDKDYQLWYVTNDAKISAAVFRPQPDGSYKLELSLPPDVVKGLAATAVTLEPKGGSPQPTGQFYLMGSI